MTALIASLIAKPLYYGERKILEEMIDIVFEDSKVKFVKIESSKVSLTKYKSSPNNELKYYYSKIVYDSKNIGNLTIGIK